MTPEQQRALARARARARLQQQEQASPPPPERGQSRSFVEEAEQGLAAINRGIPFAQDLTAALGGARSVAQGGSFDEGYQGQAQRNRDLTTDIRTRRPNAAAFLEGTGNAVPVIATMGAAAPQTVASQAATQATSRGLPLLANQAVRGLGGGAPAPAVGRGFSLFAQQTGRAGAQGAAWGELYGAGTGDAAPGLSLDERMFRGNVGGATGGAFVEEKANRKRGSSGRVLYQLEKLFQGRPARQVQRNLQARCAGEAQIGQRGVA